MIFMLVNNAGQMVNTLSEELLAGRVTYTLPLSNDVFELYCLVVRTGYRSYTEKLIIK